MPGTTDTKKAKVPLGSFIMNYGSSRMYPELEPLARMFSADKDDMSRTQNVILTNGEIYFPPDAVEAIGVEKLEYMNNESKDGAHDAIDKEMAMNLLKSIKPMYGGGNVMPMGTGGMLDNYAGGGSIMNQYGHGGMVKQDMMNYKHGGKVHKNLKPVPQGNPGLGKLPEAVRNKMGYMKEGGEVESQTLKDMLDPYLPRKDDILPYLEFVTGASAETEDYQPGAIDAALAIPLVGGVGSGIKRLIKSAGQKKALKNIAKQEDLARYTFPDYSGESLDISSKEMSNVLKILGGKYPIGTV